MSAWLYVLQELISYGARPLNTIFHHAKAVLSRAISETSSLLNTLHNVQLLLTEHLYWLRAGHAHYLPLSTDLLHSPNTTLICLHIDSHLSMKCVSHMAN